MVKTFDMGGIHPPENKISKDCKIEVFPVPEEVYIPLRQHIGAPVTCLVKKGDKVKVGTKIAEAGGFVSANIHSSVSGEVTKIDEFIGPSGYLEEMVVIKTEGDEWEECIIKDNSLDKDIKLSGKEIIERVKEAGIVGLGGAGFPSHVKLSPPEGKKADVLILNGTECEPYLTTDHRLMLEKADEIMVGTTIVMRALKVKRAVIGIEANKPDAIKLLTEKAKDYEGIEVQSLKVKYPQGGEKQLIQAIIKKEVPSGGLPIDVGAVVHNVGTIFSIYEAVQKNKPLIESVTTVTGKHLSKQANFLVRIGTKVQYLIDACGGLPENTRKIVSGGPMMGKALVSTDVPTTKTCSSVLLLDEAETFREEENHCIRCGKCVEVCPAGLAPYLIAAYAKNEMWEEEMEIHALDCIECASCTHMCPAKIPLLDYCRLAKSEIRKMKNTRK